MQDNFKIFEITAHYTTTFFLDDTSAKLVELSLGKVMVAGKIKVNGQYAGGVWTAPYKLNITEFVHEGENTLQIDLTNNWINRLIGDSRLPENERGTWTHMNPGGNAPLQQSGITGPVCIVTSK